MDKCSFLEIELNLACTSGDPATHCTDSLAECRNDGTGAFKCLCQTNYFEKNDGSCAARKSFWKNFSDRFDNFYANTVNDI